MAGFHLRIPRQRGSRSAHARSDCETHRPHAERCESSPVLRSDCLTKCGWPAAANVSCR